MSEWELMTRRRSSRHSRGKDWDTKPCIAISKDGFRFNEHFVQMYIGDRKAVEVLVKPNFVGFKIVPLGEMKQHSYEFRYKGNSSTCCIKCSKIMERFDGYYGTAFKVTRADGIVTVSLDIDNMCE